MARRRFLVQPTYSGAMSARWLAVLFTAAAFVATPLLISARAAHLSEISATELAGQIRRSAHVGWSGFVETSGTLQVPDNESFATLAQLLGENTQLRVWWRSADDWRVDRIRSTGETDLFRHGWGIASLGLRVPNCDVLTGFQDQIAGCLRPIAANLRKVAATGRARETN